MFVGINLGINQLRSSVSFSPAVLFALGEPGVWFDPSDVANLNWRVNLLTWTEQFDNAAWSKATASITANSAAAPDGTMTADTFIKGSSLAGAWGYVVQAKTITFGVPYTYSVYVKAINLDQVRLQGATFEVAYSFATNSFTTTTPATSTSATPAGNGWIRLAVTDTNSSSQGDFLIGSQGASDGTQGFLIWGAQLELGSVATTYQPITDVNTEVIQRFPYATLYQENTGATAVTTPGQTVGLMLDKSKQQSWFDVTGAVWTKTAGDGVVTVSGNTITITGATTTTLVTRTAGSIPFTSGQARMIIQADWVTATGVNVWLRGGPAAPVNGVQTLRTATLNNSNLERLDVATGSVTFTISSFQYWAGNHATQATIAARPTYSIEPVGGRRNLLTWSEGFDNAVWNKTAASVPATNGTAPDGTATADTLREDGTNNTHVVAQSPSASASTAYTVSTYFKREAGTRNAYIQVNNNTGGTGGACFAWFDLTGSGTASAVTDLVAGFTSTSAAIASLGSGWYRCTLSFTTVASTTSLAVFPGIYNAARSYTGDGTSGILLWGAQLELGSTATAYQKVTTQHDVTEAGVASVGYLYFDGTDDAMATSTITPATDKAQVFSGLRKLNDAPSRVLVEYSPTVNTSPGSFGIFAPSTASYTGSLNGSAQSITNIAGFPAPITNVISALYNIAGATIAEESIYRINGVVPAQTNNGVPAGTGNFGNYSLSIGYRPAVGLYLWGHLYSLITRFGPVLDAPTIASTETWVAGKTGFYTPIITGVPTIGVS